VALVDWWQGAAQGTDAYDKGEAWAAPGSQWARGSVTGERVGAEAVGRLGEKVSAARTPGVRWGVGIQSGVDRGQEEHDKGWLVLWFDQGQRAEAGGMLAWAETVDTYSVHDAGDLGQQERGRKVRTSRRGCRDAGWVQARGCPLAWTGGGLQQGFRANLAQDLHRPTSLFSPNTRKQKRVQGYSGGRRDGGCR
jgi:hypothetical protein